MSMAVDTRLEDYLQDKLQTSADLETLDGLLQQVREQQALLRAQLEDAEAEARKADATSKQYVLDIEQKSKSFQKTQSDIDRRLLIITQSDTSQDAVKRFEASLAKLRRLELANGYLGLLAEVDRLSRDATSKLTSSPDDALETYNALRKLHLSLGTLQDNAEGAAPHLLDHIDSVTLSLRRTIRDALARDLDVILKKILWPKPAVALPQSVQQEWDIAVIRLLNLQQAELEVSQEQNPESEVPPPPPVLLPLEVLVAPLEARFQYHFNGDRPTNRLDKPEYYLSHVQDLLKSHDEFVNDYLQPLLLTHFRGTPMAHNPIYIDATSAFITSLLPMLRSKLISTISQIASQPVLLSHFVHELMDFDTTLRTDWHYTGSTTDPSSHWKGMTWEVLMHHDYFTRWLSAEKSFALKRYQSIIDDTKNASLDFESTGPGTTKPTLAAIQVHDLLETITDRYRPLFSFTNKLRFLIEIQISIFDRFHNRLQDGLNAFLTLTTGVGRVVQGASSADLAAVQGTNGLDRLCRIFGSADYLERKMRDWSDDVFFLDLWTELQYRARNSNNNKHIDVAEVAARTSQTLAEDTQDTDTGALFDETASHYAALRAKAEDEIVNSILKHLRELLRPYSRSNAWATLSSTSSTSSNAVDDLPAPSLDLSPILDYLSTSFGFLSTALAPLPLRRIAKQVLKMLDTYTLDRLILAHSFSLHGAKQMRADVEAVVRVFERVDGMAEVGRRGLRRCLEGVVLLGLVAGKGQGDGRAGADEEGDAWDVPEEEEGSAEHESKADGHGQAEAGFNLWHVEKRLFESNESARDMLEEMGLEALTESEARQVLQRRVELAT